MSGQRDAAVARLINAVGDLLRRYEQDGGDCVLRDDYWSRRALYDIREAHNHLAAIPLEVPTEPKTRTTAPLTAHWAARSMRNSTLHGKILRVFDRENIHAVPAGDGAMTIVSGWTVEELERRLAVKHQTCSPRVNELRNSGWIYAPGRTRKNSSGRDAEVYKLTLIGEENMRQARYSSMEEDS